MKRLPIVPTLLVALACAAMIALGVWQLGRRTEKAALLAQLAANQHLPAITYPQAPDDRLLFRRASVTCAKPASWQTEAGRAADATPGWRRIAFCGAGVAVQLGIAPTGEGTPDWPGGTVTGYLTHLPQHQSAFAGLWEHGPKPMMLMADTPLPGLKANPPPDLSAVPNNHLAYAVQWFLFAAVAAIIYAVALGRR